MSGLDAATRARLGLGASVPRPDGVPKVEGRFAFSSDLWADGMLWGATLRAPMPAARIRRLDVGPALQVAGVRGVVTAADVPGSPTYGLDVTDQPVFASDVVRYAGEPIAAVAADHPDTARRAAAAIAVEYEPVEPLVDPELAIDAPPIHPLGNVVRHQVIRHGDVGATAPVVVEGTYVVGMQDQAFLGPESGLAIPADDGGVDLYVSTQWLHADRDQVAACLGIPEEMVRITLSGVGGAFGAREDLSLHVHASLLALRTGCPVKIVYSREESFHGHVHRHPARLHCRHHATRDGHVVKVEVRVVLDGGAYASTSSAVLGNAVTLAAGPYRVPNAMVEGWAVRTNNPPCGAMRGFGAVQVCFAHEAQMDRLATALGIDAVEVRLRNVMTRGDALITGQRLDGAVPVAEVVHACANHPLPDVGPAGVPEMARPGGAGRTADADHLRRGVGFAVGFKNLMFSEGFDDSSTARCRLRDGVVSITCAAAEVGQGFVTLVHQIVPEVLGIEEVVLEPAQTDSIGSAGSTSASRQTWMSGGAVEAACRDVRERLIAKVAARRGVDPSTLETRDGRVVSRDGSVDVTVADALAGEELVAEVTFRHRATEPLDADGQGSPHVSFAFAAHRAVVDVDPELGLVRVVELVTAQDVGRVLNPVQLLGQLEGGAAQGLGLAVMEEMVLDQGRIRNPSFTDYLIPTMLDMPPVAVAALVEEPEPGAPFGAKGVGEPPSISSTAAIVAAIRDATGLELPRVPVRPDDIALRGAAP